MVHDSHGIGKFVRMEERTIGKGADASRREYLVLEYAPSKRGEAGDQLYVPMDQLDMLSRYVGGESPRFQDGWGRLEKHQAQGAVLSGKSRVNLCSCTPPAKPRRGMPSARTRHGSVRWRRPSLHGD